MKTRKVNNKSFPVSESENLFSRVEGPTTPTNRGALTPPDDKWLDFLPICVVDWLTFNFRCDMREKDGSWFFNFEPSLHLVVKLLGLRLEQFERIEKGVEYPYRDGIETSGIRIFYGAPESRKIRVAVSGQGCRLIENSKTFETWPKVFQNLDSLKPELRRLDVAFDEFIGLLNLPTLIGLIDKGYFTCRAQTSYYQKHYCQGIYSGATLYFGQRVNNTFMRIYDKAAQIRAVTKGGICSEVLKEGCSFDGKILDGDSCVNDPWNRLEIEYKKEKAQKIFQEISQGDLESVLVDVVGWIRFLSPGKSKHKNKWKDDPNWKLFCSGIKSHRVTISKTKDPEKIKKSVRWLRSVVSPTLRRLKKAGVTDAELSDIFFKEVRELNKLDKNLIKKLKEELSITDLDDLWKNEITENKEK